MVQDQRWSDIRHPAGKMERVSLGVFLALFCAVFVAGSLDPRGARPVEPSTRSENCPSKKEWPFCSDDDWGPKCPSGCRIQGLMDKHDFSLLKKIEKIRNLLDQNKAKFRTADQASKQTYDYLKDKLTLDSDNSNKYYALAQNLRRNINDMKIKIDAQLRALAALKDRVRDQVSEMQRLEVDIDIKLRSCKGSCERYSAYQMEVGSYVALEKQLKQLDSPSSQSVKGVETLYVMKSRPLKDDPVDSLFKAKDLDGQQKEDVFHEINTVTLLLEQEGSSSSPATVSKVPVCVRLAQQKPSEGQPAEHIPASRAPPCGSQLAAALCSDEDWGSRCPCGCRVQGLILQKDRETSRNLREVCQKAERLQNVVQRSSRLLADVCAEHLQVMADRQKADLATLRDAEKVATTLTSLQERWSSLWQQVDELRGHAHKQVGSLYRAEVDLDMKLRACAGSCRSSEPFRADHGGYRALQTDVEQLDRRLSRRWSGAKPPNGVPQVRLLQAGVGSPGGGAKPQRELLTQLQLVGQKRVALEPPPEQS